MRPTGNTICVFTFVPDDKKATPDEKAKESLSTVRNIMHIADRCRREVRLQ